MATVHRLSLIWIVGGCRANKTLGRSALYRKPQVPVCRLTQGPGDDFAHSALCKIRCGEIDAGSPLGVADAESDRMRRSAYFFSAVNVPLPRAPYSQLPLIFEVPSSMPV